MNAAPALFPADHAALLETDADDSHREESGVSLIQRFVDVEAQPDGCVRFPLTSAGGEFVTSTLALQSVAKVAVDADVDTAVDAGDARDLDGPLEENVPEAVLQAAVNALSGNESVAEGGAFEPREDDKDVALAINGDRNAFRALYKRYRGIVLRVICRMGVPQADLEDTIQEVFVQVHRSLRDFRSQAKFSTWLHRVAVNVVLMQRRALKSRPQYAEEPTVEVAGDRALPDDEAERNERVRAFDRMLNKLAEKKRTVFMLHDLEGMTPQEIADIVDAPVLTVRTRLFYARRELEVMIAGEPALAQVRGTFSKAALEQG